MSYLLNLFKQPLLLPGTKLSSFLEDGVDKSDKFDKCSMLRHVIDKGYKTLNKRRVQYNSARKVDLLCPLSQKQVGASQESGNGQMNMNQVDQTPLSPLSYGDTKCSDNDSSDHVRVFLASELWSEIPQTTQKRPPFLLSETKVWIVTCDSCQHQVAYGAGAFIWNSNALVSEIKASQKEVQRMLQEQSLIISSAWKLRRKSTKFGGASQLMVNCFFCLQMIKQSSSGSFFSKRKRLLELQDGQASAMPVSNGSTSNGISNGNHSVKNSSDLDIY
ncbi:hypothetical protein REPUB_Repub07fG0068000 [Reevesia pubescens]